MQSIIGAIDQGKPRNYLQLLQTYQRLLRLELDKRARDDRISPAALKSCQPRNRFQPGAKIRPGLTTDFMVNPSLLGGVRVRVGSDVWDGSVRTRLERLQQQLSNLTNYHEQHSGRNRNANRRSQNHDHQRAMSVSFAKQVMVSLALKA